MIGEGGRKKEVLAYFGMVLNTSITGLSFIFMKVALKHTTPLDLLAHRFTAAMVVVVGLWAAGLIRFPRFDKARLKPLLLLALFYPVLFFTLQTFGMKFSTASEAGIIFAVTPILTLLSAMIFLKERTSWLQKLGILLSVGGVILIILKTNSHLGASDPRGVVLLLLSVLSVVTYYTVGKKAGQRFSALELTVLMTFLAFVTFNLWAAFVHYQTGTLNQFFVPLKQPGFLIPVLYLGILSSLLTSFLSNFALTAIPASKIAVFNNLSPIISVLGGIFILYETLYAYHIVGGLLVLTGVAATVLFKYRN